MNAPAELPLSSAEPGPQAYCLGCRYNLRGLTEPRCPECGRAFDPGDPRTWSTTAIRKRRLSVLIPIYVLPLALLAAFWIQFVLTRGPRYGIRGLGSAVWATALSACGPILWVLPDWCYRAPAAVYVLVALLWGGWLALVSRSPLRRLPYWVHALLAVAALVWCFVGFATVAISV
jgi:hypothetical protein